MDVAVIGSADIHYTRMQAYLDLVDMWRVDFRKALQLFDVADTPIADTNALGLAILQQLFKSKVHLLPVFRAPTGSVYQK